MFSTDALRKLHQLCALEFPEGNEEEIEKLKIELKESKRLIDLLKDDDQFYRSVPKTGHGSDFVEVIGGRVYDEGREDPDEAILARVDVTDLQAQESEAVVGRPAAPDSDTLCLDGTGVLDPETLLSYAKLTRDGYFVVEGTGRGRAGRSGGHEGSQQQRTDNSLDDAGCTKGSSRGGGFGQWILRNGIAQ